MSHRHINDLLRHSLRVQLALAVMLYAVGIPAQDDYVPEEIIQEQPQEYYPEQQDSQPQQGLPTTQPAVQPLERPPMGPESATLNLNNADIRILINTVSKATGQNFIVDPRVKGKVTVVSAKPMTKDEIYEVFLAVLQVHGFAAVPADGIVKIVPDATAKQSSVPMGAAGESNSDQLVTRVLQLENVAAGQLVPIIRPLVPQQGHLAAYAPTNVLVITDRASNISRMVDIIRRIDRPDNEEIEIIRLENASASEMVRIIQGVMQKQQQEGGVPGAPLLTADERTNSILLTGDKSSRLRIRTIIAQLDTPLESGGNTKVVFLKYAAAANLVAILQGVIEKSLGDQQQAPAPGQPRISIQADETTNSLVITAPSSAVRQLETIIRQLDIPRAQVLIEAIIAEVSTGLAAELGTQFLVDGSGDGSGPVGGSLFSESFNLNSFIARGATEGGVGGAAPTIGDGLTVALGDRTAGTQFAFILRALKGDSATNILSTPTLVTLDNVEAEIVFGQNVPFVTGSFANTGGGVGVTNPFQTIERQDVGITLKVKPQINEGNAIKLQIQQEVSSLESSAVASDVVTNKRAIRTEVMIEDGQTIVLGGLIKDEFRDTVRKVPLLGSIPVLGRLFSFTKTEKIKSNLMVFIRPVILEGSPSSNHFTSQKYSLIRARQLEAKIGKRGLIKDSAAELPNIEVLFAPVPGHLKAKNSRQLPENQNTAPQPRQTVPQPQATTSAPTQPVTATGQPAGMQPESRVEPVTATGQPADTQPETPVEPVTSTGQPAQPATQEQAMPPADTTTQQHTPDTTALPEIQLSE